MYLKTLVLKGFKSFANRSVLSLEPGLMVIVGPNGSGKSNITDAILWVLGEQSAKALRGQTMEDVIFAGSSAHKAVSVAEVDLVLDNSCGTLPLDFNEVVITRRMYRSGESEYLINSSPARLMDVLDILHDSGIGRNTQSIISQGNLESVLMSKPEDRRALIEEAAGILKHKKRKERSARKLASMDAHLTRVKDISNEIEKQLRPLERQAAKAQKHGQLSSELAQLETALLVDDLNTLQSLWNEMTVRAKNADMEVDFAKYQLAEKEKELEKLRVLFEEKGLFIGDIAEQRRRARTVLVSLDSGMLLLEEKGKNMVDRLSGLRATIFKAQTKETEDKATLERVESERLETSSRLQALYTQLNECRRDSEALRRTRVESDQQLTQLNSQLRAKKKAIDDCKNELSRSTESVQSLQLEMDMLNHRYEQADEQFNTNREALSSSRNRVEEAEKKVANFERDEELARRDIDKRVRLVDDRRKNLDSARDILTSIRSELKGLQEIDRAFTSASPALKWAVEHENDFYSEVLPVSTLFKAPAEYEQITERLLGTDLFGMMVEDVESANLLVERLVKEGVTEGDVTVLPKANMTPNIVSIPGATRLIDVLEYADEHKDAAGALLGDVFLVDSLRDALKAHVKNPEARFATSEGVIVWQNGKITLGTQTRDVEGVLARHRRIETLEEELPQVEATMAEAELALSEAEEALRLAQNDEFEIAQNLASVRGEHESAMKDLSRLEQVLATCVHERDSIDSRRDALKAKINAATPLNEEIEKRLATLTEGVDELEETVAQAEEARRKAFDEETEATSRLSACQVEIATVSEREVHYQTQVASLKDSIKESAEIIAAAKMNSNTLEVLRQRIEPLHAIYTELQTGVIAVAEKLQTQAGLEQQGTANLREAVKNAEDAVTAARATLEERTKALNEIRVEQGKLELSVETAVKEIVEKTQLPIEKALEIEVPDQDRIEIENRVLKLQRKLSNIGPINAVAEQEYEALKTRRDFIQSQIDDLEASRKALQKIVAAIDKKMRQSFLETFEKVDSNFREIFSELFPGGTGYLSLTDPDSPETTGVEVNAQPKGKKLKKMTLMSGGEKSLTAMALLFALYKTRTVPFYVLDEVEAALDDVNLHRLLSYLETMRNDTQFIMISHQRATMERADCLYGVSMQADGVSQLVSRKLNRETKQEEL